jgi:hypothetical protein
MKLVKTLKELCTPAFIYFMLSMFTLIVIVIQNIMKNGEFCVGYLSCPSSNMMKVMVLSVEILYIVFWTWILTLICKSGYKSIAWAIVLFPFVLMFLLLGLFILRGNQALLV